MTWIAISALAVGGFAVLVVGFRLPRGCWEVVLAALVMGLAGYALQSNPDYPGAPRAADENATASPAELVSIRQKLSGDNDQGNKWLIVADALSRHGEFGDAANILRNAVVKNPQDAQEWLALANALVSHSQGSLSPAAMLAFRRAANIDPNAPGPPFFLGLALARSGQLIAARRQWEALLDRSPGNASWRPDLTQKLSELDKLIEQSSNPKLQP